MKLLILFAALAASLCAQGRFSATTGDVSLTASGTTLTIQQPANTGSVQARQVAFESATVYCSVACNVTQAQNGTAATATAGTLTPILPNLTTPAATAWTASNVGAGTAVGGTIHLAAGQTVVINLAGVTMQSGSTATNYSVTVSSITGTANITIIEVEK